MNVCNYGYESTHVFVMCVCVCVCVCVSGIHFSHLSHQPPQSPDHNHLSSDSPHLSPAIKTPFKSTLLPVTHCPVYRSLPRTDTRPSVHLPVYAYLSELLQSSRYTPSKIPVVPGSYLHDSHLHYLSINHPAVSLIQLFHSITFTCYSRLCL